MYDLSDINIAANDACNLTAARDRRCSGSVPCQSSEPLDRVFEEDRQDYVRAQAMLYSMQGYFPCFMDKRNAARSRVHWYISINSAIDLWNIARDQTTITLLLFSFAMPRLGESSIPCQEQKIRVDHISVVSNLTWYRTTSK
jgi:hypothetical protein